MFISWRCIHILVACSLFSDKCENRRYIRVKRLWGGSKVSESTIYQCKTTLWGQNEWYTLIVFYGILWYFMICYDILWYFTIFLKKIVKKGNHFVKTYAHFGGWFICFLIFSVLLRSFGLCWFSAKMFIRLLEMSTLLLRLFEEYHKISYNIINIIK